ncbi:histidinol-phosphate transaminase [Lignipirellula cremea]|uniref:Histidinol-phosphate aminotransferase n=1 Tax=Lignipirellula cremea TaxID=2528010 RepID=A0A518DUY5_9BACT|nr:histidinol-phosphate transaminase [Lignipirellula cremea]QDU95643.1 Histidinol-phosphate aminotransferase [Lignipirellula cremea]
MSFFRPEIEAMQGYTPGEQPQAGKFIKLNTNENPYPPSPAVPLAIQTAAQTLVRYPDPVGTAFRQRAAEVLGVEPDWILCGNGSDDILTIVTRAFVGPGQSIRLPYPSYILYRTLAQLQGARWQEIPFQPDWSLPAAFTEGTDELKLVFLPNPNSPTGTVLSPEEVLAIAERLPCPLVVDEAYVDFAEQSCIDLVKENEKILVSRTLSKSYALAGLRFGFLVAQPHLIAELIKVKDSYNCDALSLAAATAAIDDQAWLQANVEKVKASRKRLLQGVRRLGFTAPDSQANFVWCVHEKPVKPLYEQLKASRILVRYMNYPDWGEGLRISVGDDGQIDACLSLLETLLK